MDTHSPFACLAREPASLRCGLVQAGRAVVAAASAPWPPAFSGMVLPEPSGETAADPDRHLDGVDDAYTALAKHLALARYRGHLAADNCHVLAGQFLGLLRANPVVQTAIGLRRCLAEREVEAAVDAMVDLFLSEVCGDPAGADAPPGARGQELVQ